MHGAESAPASRSAAHQTGFRSTFKWALWLREARGKEGALSGTQQAGTLTPASSLRVVLVDILPHR